MRDDDELVELSRGVFRSADALAVAYRAPRHDLRVSAGYRKGGRLVPGPGVVGVGLGGRRRDHVDGVVPKRALDRLVEMRRPGRTDWGLGTEVRSRALLSDGEDADLPLRGDRAVRPDRAATELARAHLLYGEWLRREGRKETREQLRTAHQMFVGIGMEAFAERTHR